jgi:prephenate dehydrogenase
LGTLFQEAGIEVRAFDPNAKIPEQVRASSIEALVADAEFVVVAVPVPQTRAALEALAPHLQPTHVVFDVGSVKVKPAAILEQVLGSRIAWVATHPLFGPTSLALGERPLRVVICGNALHPDAVLRVGRLFQDIGCQVLEQDPDTHDRTMAWTQALAFFVAKGMLDAGVPVDIPYITPSFQAIARTVTSARSDAGHLFTVLHRENPYAAEARRKLLDVLTAADSNLLQASLADAQQDPGSLAIPDLGSQSPELRETRELIDEIDQQIMALLSQRAQLSRRALRAKAEIGRGVYDPIREAKLLEQRREWALNLGLDADGITEIFGTILRYSRRIQS